MGSDPERLGVTGLESSQWVIGEDGLPLVGHRVPLLWVVPLRGFAHGLTLSSLRRTGVSAAKTVLVSP